MTLGVFGARSDRRGLATLSKLMWSHLQPAKTVVIDMGTHAVTAFDPDQYGDATTITYDDARAGYCDLDEWLEGLDTVLTFEVAYDPKLYDVCRRRGVKTVELCMPELDSRQRDPHRPRPDVIALPTSWMAERYPGCPILPVPSDPWQSVPGDLVVHPSAWAMADRNGTRTVIDASVFTAQRVVVRGQSSPDQPWKNAAVEVADLPESRDLFNGAGLVVIPRRYGGLSMTMTEVLSAGLPLLLAEHDPYSSVVPREARLRSIRGRDLQAIGGSIATWSVEPRELAERIDLVMADGELRAEMSARSTAWALANSWEHLKPAWDAVLGSTVPA